MTPVVSPLDAIFGSAIDSFCGVTLPLARFADVTAAGASCTDVMLPGVIAPPGADGSGRGNPPVRALKAKLPLLPALSVHGPLTVASAMRASTSTGRPPGTVMMWRPKPIVPSGFGVATPTSGARCPAPHWSSKPSTVKSAPCWVTLSERLLQ
jgi:hypothetical protein